MAGAAPANELEEGQSRSVPVRNVSGKQRGLFIPCGTSLLADRRVRIPYASAATMMIEVAPWPILSRLPVSGRPGGGHRRLCILSPDASRIFAIRPTDPQLPSVYVPGDTVVASRG